MRGGGGCGYEWIVTKNGRKSRKHTTKGWYLEVQWRDGTTPWAPFKDLKEGNPIEVAEYAMHVDISHEPVFAW